MRGYTTSASIAAFVAFLVGSTAAIAGGSIKDTPEPVKYAFHGVYVGVQGSYNFVEADGDWDTSATNDTFFDSFDLDGFGAGVVLGYNYRFGNLLVGIEADYQGLDSRDTRLDNESPNRMRDTVDISSQWSVRGRLGYVHNNSLLIFGTVGVGQLNGQVDLEQSVLRNTTFFANGLPDVPVNFRVEENGVVYGGGIEWAFAKNLSLKVEYQRFDVDAYYDLSGKPDGDPGDNLQIKAVDSVRVGVNFHLN